MPLNPFRQRNREPRTKAQPVHEQDQALADALQASLKAFRVSRDNPISETEARAYMNAAETWRRSDFEWDRTEHDGDDTDG